MLAELLRFDLTAATPSVLALCLFVFAYLLVVLEEKIHLRKSKPVVLAAGMLWLLVSIAYSAHPDAKSLPEDHMEQRILHHTGEYGQLFLFLMVAMTYISAIAQHNVFLKLNSILVSKGLSLRAIFWATGTLAFWISPIADNMTTALLMGTVAVTVGRGNPKFVSLACINVVVAANAGGAFSPFGDITTLMVWTAQKVHTETFLWLLPPSLVNWLVPAAVMHFMVPIAKPEPLQQEAELREGWLVVILLFLATIATSVVFHMAFHVAPYLGMTTGLGYYFLYGWHRTTKHHKHGRGKPLDVFENVAQVEWDTMLFFFGVVMCVGALQELGYLALVGNTLFDAQKGIGPFWANVGIGLLSAVIDNVPVMFAVLGMNPPMDPTGELHTKASDFQWLLVTMTAGVGGSLLSVGSAAGVALMGAARGVYTFGSHLKALPAIAMGYVAAIWVHWLISGV